MTRRPSFRHGSPSNATPGTGISPDRSSAIIDRGSLGHVQIDGDDDVNREDDVVHEVIMALDFRQGASMGCAVFSTVDGTLGLSYDVPMADLGLAEQLLTHLQPTTLLVSARAPEDLMNFLEERSASNPQGIHRASACHTYARQLTVQTSQ